VFLVLNTLAQGKEVIISRGELVEIGGSFRIPDVMKRSGAILKETGTTNRTYREDFARAVSENTALFMKVHTSNYRIRGFTHDTKVEELVSLGKEHDIPVFYDAGSGLLFPIREIGLHDEPFIPGEMEKGIDILCFSGDKLLGATQAGIILGKMSHIDSIKENPLTRALRPDKFTLAGLEATLLLYLDERAARREIPTLRMIHEEKTLLKERAKRVAAKLRRESDTLSVSVVELYSEVGGGAFPDVSIPSFGISLKPGNISIETFEERLRNLSIPIVGRIEKDKLLLDVRTILRDDEPILVSGIRTVLKDAK
jgi:L-seryl-tRNA(Ser) seleniumtransferase